MKTCYFLRKKKWSSIMIFEYNVIIFPFNEWIISREKMYVIHISTHQIQLRLKKQSMWKLMTQWKIKSGKRVNLMKTSTLHTRLCSKSFHGAFLLTFVRPTTIHFLRKIKSYTCKICISNPNYQPNTTKKR